MILIMLIVANSLINEYQDQKIDFLWTQSKKHSTILANKIILGALLSLLYIISLILFSLLFGLIRNDLTFYAFYPLKVFSLSNIEMPLILFFIKSVLLFFAKSFLLTSIVIFLP